MNIAKERDDAFIDAVLNDNWDGVIAYSKKYGVPIPEKERVMKCGVFKAVQYCTNIPDDVKGIAMQKCIELGMSPFIIWEEGAE